MSQSYTCTNPVYVQPCTYVNGACYPTFPPNTTGLVLQNYVTNPVVAFSTNLYSPQCFQLPAQPVGTDVTSNPIYVVTFPGTTPIQFALYDSITQNPYGLVNTVAVPPSLPVQVNPTPPPIVNPTNTSNDWTPPDIRSKKPVWVFIVAGILLILAGIAFIVMGARRNSQVFRLYAQMKEADTPESLEVLAGDEGLEPEYKPFYSTSMIVVGSILIAIVIGLVVGSLFLPGYPLSKYMSYAQCQALAQQEPTNIWSWSIPPLGAFYKFACKAFGACVCRSLFIETNCFNYALVNSQYAPNVWQGALKHPPNVRDCFCCDNQTCGTVVNNQIQSCQTS